ncbi:MAG: c-type cytochrome [Nitrospirota bacterium]
MKKAIIATVFLSAVCAAGAVIGPDQAAAGSSGEALFKQHCALCHPDGGNIINPQKTLLKKDRDANTIKTAADIVRTMRNPGPGMTKFDDKTIPDKDAKEIAEYILKTFK